MLVAKKLVGVLSLNVVDKPRPFTLGQMKGLTILAGTAAAALESASLHMQVQQAEKNYRSIFENAVEGIFRSTPDGKFITVNPALAQILGYESPDEVVNSFTDIGQQLYVNPSLSDEIRRTIAQGQLVRGFEFEAYRKDRRKIWLSLNVSSIRDDQGKEICREGTIEDITERKRAEERYRDLVENAHDIIYSHDLKGNYTSINKAGEQITGYTRAEALRLNLIDTIAPDFLDKAREMLRRKLRGERVTAYEMEIIAKDGRRVAVEANTKLVRLDGVPVGVQGIARDITERKRMEKALRESEEQLRQSQKMEAIGQLAGGVAHDFNNLLTAINGYSSLAMRRLDKDHPVQSYLEEIVKGGDRAANLTRQLLAFGRKQLLQPLLLNLNDVVRDMQKMLKDKWNRYW
jgi:PAS domain S-box-containing protein